MVRTKKTRKEKEVGQAKFYSQISGIEKFLETSKLRYLNSLLQIEKLSSMSKLFVYAGIISSILFILSIFWQIFWVIAWIFIFFSIIMVGFLAAKPGKKYNITLVLGIFFGIAFIPSIYGQGTLSMFTPLDQQRMTVQDIVNIEDELMDHVDTWSYTKHDLRAGVVLFDLSAEGCEKYFKSSSVNQWLRDKLSAYIKGIHENQDQFERHWLAEMRDYLKTKVTTTYQGVTMDQIDELICDYGYSYDDLYPADQRYFQTIILESNRRILKYYVELNQRRYYSEDNENFEGSTQQDNDIGDSDEYTIVDLGGFKNSLEDLANNPLQDIAKYTTSFIDVINWIVFIAIIAYAGSAIAEGIKLNLSETFKRAAFIALAVAVMTMVYGIFQSVDIGVRSVWDTVGGAWTSLMKNIGLATLDQNADDVVTVYSIGNGLFAWIPLIFPLISFGLAIGFRKTDFESLLFAKSSLEKDTIEIKDANFSLPTALLLAMMSLYLIGYVLITADPIIEINIYVTVAFYIVTFVGLLGIGTKYLIVDLDDSLNYDKIKKNEDLQVWKEVSLVILKYAWKTMKWTLFGIMGLFLWFQMFQPTAYYMNLIDDESSLLVLSQGQSFYESDILEQLFLVAAPETIIFQVVAIGIGNRIKAILQKSSSKAELRRLKEKRWEVAIDYRNITLTPNSLSRANLRKIVKMAILRQKFDQLTSEIEKKQITRLPRSKFIFSSMGAGAIGSFFFSFYHSFRRGISFWDWWQNPAYGLIYAGAGFFLCLISFFCWPAAIIVHWLNNLLSMWISGGA